MNRFKRNIYKTSESQTVILDPFDYIIVTYQYTPPSGEDYDLDTITALRYQSGILSGTTSNNILGTLNNLPTTGCSGRFFTPNTISVIQDSYLAWGGDDNIQAQEGTFGESVVINFKNLGTTETGGIVTSNDVVVDLYAGWHSGTILYPINIKYETFIGGVITREIVGGLETNRFVVDATVQNPGGTRVPITLSESPTPKNITSGNCSAGVDGSNAKQKVASVFFNLLTKVARVEFY